MNPDGMIALLNYREDGVTRMPSLSVSADQNTYFFWISLLHLLERRSQRGQALISVPRCHYSFLSWFCWAQRALLYICIIKCIIHALILHCG